MCGIAGYCHPKPDKNTLQIAADRLSHRGPDDAGVHTEAGIGLAARRLSIIDLAGGHQPLSNEDGSVWIAYNGEIFNAPELRKTLKKRGHCFKTKTDTEVVVHAYEEWGLEALPRFRGMFAFALWDASRERLLLARDRFGIKPLYYTRNSGRLAFASEIRPLFILEPALTREPDYAGLGELFRLGYIPTPLSPFAGVKQLPAAHTLVFENGRVQIQPYWTLSYPVLADHKDMDESEAAAAFQHKLREAVDAWRMSDVPVGSLLSGGIDSASLAALLTDITNGPIHTFTIRFSEASHDESERARAVADHIGSIHHELDFNMDSFDRLPDIVTHLESPQCSLTSIPIALLYQACRESGFKVIMTGEGADELLGGYHWFDGDRRARPLLSLPHGLRRLLAAAPLGMSPAARRVLRAGSRDPVRRYFQWTGVSRRKERSQLLAFPDAPVREFPHGFSAGLDGRHPLDQFLLLDSHTRMVDFINFEVDRMSMMHSVEARPPFLDHPLWEFTAGLAPHLKLTPGANKRLLRKAMEKYLPAATIRQPKKGLAAPHAAWWRQPTLSSWAEESLSPTSLVETGLFQPQEVARLREAHRQGKGDHSRLLTGVLTTQIWFDRLVKSG